MKLIGVKVLVAINHFITDTDSEIKAIKDYVVSEGSEAILCKHWANGSKGTIDLAKRVVEIADKDDNDFELLYDDKMPLLEKIETLLIAPNKFFLSINKVLLFS